MSENKNIGKYITIRVPADVGITLIPAITHTMCESGSPRTYPSSKPPTTSPVPLPISSARDSGISSVMSMLNTSNTCLGSPIPNSPANSSGHGSNTSNSTFVHPPTPRPNYTGRF